jgi:hypothetical protein
MKTSNHIRKDRKERGIALLLTIFGLLLITAVAVAMLYSSDSETTISVNYRDKEAGTYAALSGLQEARDRLQPLTGDLATGGLAPTALPGPNNGQVLYIVNPGPGETAGTVAPWKATIGGNPNPYFDKELCQENMTALGLAAGTVGVPCTAVPTNACAVAGTGGGGWCSYYDNSANATNWQLKDPNGNPVPLDYKWVRITLKADNSAPVYIQNAGAAAGTQVCWDGTSHQVQKPAGAGTNCWAATSGSPVSKVTLTTGGAGYSLLSLPTVALTGGGGSGATATAQVTTTAGGINAATLTNNGNNYSSPPAVTFKNIPDGTGATFQALVTGAPVTALGVAGNNYCYATGATGATVNFTPSNPGTGSTAAATVAMTGQACVSAVTATASCGASMKFNTLTISSVPGGTGAGFSGTITLDNKGKYSGPVSITNVGSYTAVPGTPQTVTVSGCSITVSYAGGIQLKTPTVTSGGQYLAAPTATISGISPPVAPSATQPTVNVTWTSVGVPNFQQLSGIQVLTPGTGYAQPSYLLQIVGGAAAFATSNATATVSGLTLTNGGAGYTSAPTVVITDPLHLGSGAAGTAALAGGQPLDYGAVYMLTSLAYTRNGNGAQSMAQMEAAARPPSGFKLGGALTLAGPSPTFGSPNSNIFKINGNDANSCGQAGFSSLPAIGVDDNPNNPTSPTAQVDVISALGKPQNYIGAQSAPDVQNVYNSIPSPAALNAEVADIASQPGTINLTGPLSSLANPGTAANPTYTVVNGDLTLTGNPTGYGVLVVTGNLVLKGDFTWTGVILVIGSATVSNSGGGNGQITGAMYVANTAGGGNTLGSSTFNWNGGGGNGIQYDHCWADNLLNKFPPPPNAAPLQVLSSRTLEF